MTQDAPYFAAAAPPSYALLSLVMLTSSALLQLHWYLLRQMLTVSGPAYFQVFVQLHPLSKAEIAPALRHDLVSKPFQHVCHLLHFQSGACRSDCWAKSRHRYGSRCYVDR